MAKNSAPNDTSKNIATVEEDDNFDVVQTSRLMYAPETCGVLRGHLLTSKTFGSDINDDIRDGSFECFVVRLTKPGKGRSRDKTQIVDLAVEEEILVPITFQLSELKEKLNRPEGVYEIIITPKGKVPIGGGKTMHEYEVKCSKKPTPWSFFGLSNAPRLITETTNHAALTAGETPAAQAFLNG